MRRLLIAGNWKMNLKRDSAVQLAGALADADLPPDIDVAVCPPYVYLDAVHARIRGSAVQLGSQDVYFESAGAFTGEISTEMLRDVGCTLAIAGHSERRHVIGESDELINLKVKATLAGGLTPILCIGETLEERESGKTLEVVNHQFAASLDGISDAQMPRIILAYEPVWAIGTGKTATPEQAQEVHADLRRIISERYNSAVGEQVRILYGGSVKPENAADLLSQPDIDGALVGGAALDSDNFLKIIAAGISKATT